MTQKGAASAAITKLVNDSTGYSAAYASLAAVAYVMHKKGNVIASNILSVVGLICSLILIYYWIDHVISVCQALEVELRNAKNRFFHMVVIKFIFVVGQPFLIAITIFTVLKSLN